MLLVDTELLLFLTFSQFRIELSTTHDYRQPLVRLSSNWLEGNRRTTGECSRRKVARERKRRMHSISMSSVCSSVWCANCVRARPEPDLNLESYKQLPNKVCSKFRLGLVYLQLNCDRDCYS